VKIRQGFVSNSSSSSFICRKCHDEYEVETRCGADDDWVSPEDGLCDECMKESFICRCAEIKQKSESVRICEDGAQWQDGVEVDTGNLIVANTHICPTCFVRFSEFHEKLDEWSKKVANPGHELTPVDKEIIEEVAKHRRTNV
jgi:hypothetical protein